MPDPIHPLSWSVWKATLAPVITRAMIHLDERSPAFARASGVDLVDGRLYFNLHAFTATPILGRLMLHMPSPLDDRSDRSIRDLARRGVLRPRRNPGTTGAFLRGLLPRRDPLPSRRDPQAWLDALAAGAAAIQARPPVDGLLDEALLREILVLSQPESAVLREGLGMANQLVFIWALGTRLFRPWPEAARRLATGVAGNPTTAISLGIDRLVQLARPCAGHFADDRPAAAVLAALRTAAPGDGAARAWLAELNAFLHRFGHRAPREFDLATPRWADDPTMVVDLVRAGLGAAVGEPLAERLDRLRVERDIAVGAAIRSAQPWRRPLMRWAARAVLDWMPLREAPKHYIMRTFQRARAAALEMGRRLADRGLLAAPEDVFLLELEELEATVRQGQPVPPDLARRRDDLARWARATPPTVIRSDGVPVEEGDVGPHDPRELRGTGIGGGVGEGPVNILETPDPRQVRDGDVLVVTFADPGWTPLFPRAAAVVMEVGGSMCHAAVVARELGIPAVFAVRDAKQRLVAGERVRVDGDAGRVIRLEAGR
jgi:phosphohistidine swiveling domain-containing protein